MPIGAGNKSEACRIKKMLTATWSQYCRQEDLYWGLWAKAQHTLHIEGEAVTMLQRITAILSIFQKKV